MKQLGGLVRLEYDTNSLCIFSRLFKVVRPESRSERKDGAGDVALRHEAFKIVCGKDKAEANLIR